jgi:hypothetical protein
MSEERPTRDLTYADLQRIKKEVREKNRDYIPPFSDTVLPISRPWPQYERNDEQNSESNNDYNSQ